MVVMALVLLYSFYLKTVWSMLGANGSFAKILQGKFIEIDSFYIGWAVM